jgi:hypothetical protein
MGSRLSPPKINEAVGFKAHECCGFPEKSGWLSVQCKSGKVGRTVSDYAFENDLSEWLQDRGSIPLISTIFLRGTVWI